MPKSNPFKWRHYQAQIILRCVRWYCSYPLSYRQVAEMVSERGLDVHHTTVFSWIQEYGLEIDKRCRPHLRATNDSVWVDETYIKVKRKPKYLYPCSWFGWKYSGLSALVLNVTLRNAKRFFQKTLKAIHVQTPRVITVDKNAAYPKATDEFKAKEDLPKQVELRQKKYLNNIIEQDYRGIKRLVKPAMGFKSFNTAGANN